MYLQIICPPFVEGEFTTWFKNHGIQLASRVALPVTGYIVLVIDVETLGKVLYADVFAFVRKVEEDDLSNSVTYLLLPKRPGLPKQADDTSLIDAIAAGSIPSQYAVIERFEFLFERLPFRIRKGKEDGCAYLRHHETNNVVQWRFIIKDGLFGEEKRSLLNLEEMISKLWKEMRKHLPDAYKLERVEFSSNFKF